VDFVLSRRWPEGLQAYLNRERENQKPRATVATAATAATAATTGTKKKKIATPSTTVAITKVTIESTSIVAVNRPITAAKATTPRNTSIAAVTKTTAVSLTTALTTSTTLTAETALMSDIDVEATTTSTMTIATALPVVRSRIDVLMLDDEDQADITLDDDDREFCNVYDATVNSEVDSDFEEEKVETTEIAEVTRLSVSTTADLNDISLSAIEQPTQFALTDELLCHVQNYYHFEQRQHNPPSIIVPKISKTGKAKLVKRKKKSKYASDGDDAGDDEDDDASNNEHTTPNKRNTPSKK
jgi:hypothetical protein